MATYSLGLPGAVEGLLPLGVLTAGEDPFCEIGLCMLRFCKARPNAVIDGGGARRASGEWAGRGRVMLLVIFSRGGFAAMLATRLHMASLATSECWAVLAVHE